MGTAGEAECALEMEAMRKEDSSWHPCRVSFCSAEAGLLIEFGSQGLEDMLLHDEEALTCLRFRSAPLQGDDCTHIKEGECVLVTHKLQFKSNFYDAKVEKVVRVRHSKRVHCRCTFTIKWLHQDLEGETLTVPSSSIMKLATKSINVHPAVAVFLKSVKQMRSSCSSPSPTVLEETNGEMDLNYLLEKQIEEISNSVNASKEGISEDILFGVNGGNVDNKEHGQWNTVTVSKVSISHAQAPHDWNQLNRSIQKSREMQIELQVEGQPPAALSIQEELPENRSHLSPLAARAALASLMSTNHGHITMDGTKMFISSVFNNMPTKDKVPSEISDDSIPVISDADEMVIPLISTKSKPQQGNKKGNRVSKLTNFGVTLKCLPRERNVNQPKKAARITRSAVREGTAIQNDNVQINICSEDMKLRATTNKRRLTRAAVNEERENLVMEVKQALEDKKSSLTTESDFPKGSFSVPRSNVSKKSSDISTEKKAKSSPVTNKRRLTRSAVNEETENLVMEVKQALEAKKSSGITESGSLEGSFFILGSNVSKKSSGVSTEKKSISSLITNKRRLTRSTVNEERENLVMEVKQALEAKKSSGFTESDSLEGSFSIPGSNVSKKGSGVSIEKKSISSPITNKRRLIHSVVNEERKNLVMEAKQALEAKKSSGITESDSLEGSFSIPGSNVSKKSSGVSTKKKSISSPITNKRRLTRSAVNEERENLVMEVEQALEAKKSSCITESDSLEGGFSVPRGIVSKKSSGVLTKKKAISSLVTNKRRLTRSAVNEERENLVMEVKQALEAKKSSHITESNSPKRSFSVPKSNVFEKSSGVSTEKKAISSPVTNTRRVTRSAVNEARENLVMEVKQALEAKKSSCITELDSLEGSFSVPDSNVSKKSSGVSTEKKAISSPVDGEISIPIEERNKKLMPCAVKTTQQSEGMTALPTSKARRVSIKMKDNLSPSSGHGMHCHRAFPPRYNIAGKVSGVSQGQKRKSTSSQKQEQRFSHRLKFLPRTRSQNKS